MVGKLDHFYVYARVETLFKMGRKVKTPFAFVWLVCEHLSPGRK